MVAKLHYVGDLPQVQIAKQLGLSTATISRLLQRARAEGIVRIEVRDLVVPDALGAQLERELGLRRVSVVETPAGNAAVALAAPLGTMLKTANLGPGAVLALGWGRAIRAVLEAGLPPMTGVLVVPATGGMQQHHAHFQINEFARMAAEQAGGTAYFVHAPFLPSPDTRDIFLADPAIREAVALWDRIDVAVVGVGLPHALNAPDASLATPSEQQLVDAAGDVIRHYFDAQGRPIDWEGADRLIAVSPEQLRRARLCIGVASGEAKALSIIGAARAGLINALVTDAQTAQAVLDGLSRGL
ncbi:sugar-binding transcriptional regulator [Paragemmobacter straminiformis]|nr:sugar-binding domain-containing protein [Gemmobacter straminiformis]